MTEDTHEEDKPIWNEGFQPPPWSAEPDEDFGHEAGVPNLEAYHVVSYGYDDEMPIVCAGTKNWPLWREQALILAAALDMLTVLREIQKLQTCGPGMDARINAAIAKAEGKGQ